MAADLTLKDLHERTLPAPAWQGEGLPWSEPEFSERMLAEHLDQAHDLASRRQILIDEHIRWIEDSLRLQGTAHILDLGCGPGFYAIRLAARGHLVTGVDFSPASIRHAMATSDPELGVRWIQGDMLSTDLPRNQDLVMLLFSEFNALPRDAARQLLARIRPCLKPGGRLLLELSTCQQLREVGDIPSRWNTASRGLFSDQPYLQFEEHFWHEDQQAAVSRYYVMDLATAGIREYSVSHQAYLDFDLQSMLTEAGFDHFQSYQGLGSPEEPNLVIISGCG